MKFIGAVRVFFGRLFARKSYRRGWHVGLVGRDTFYYEELHNREWQRIEIDGEMLVGQPHHVIYFPTEVEWESKYPAWAQGRREAIIRRIKSECRPPEYEYEGDSMASSVKVDHLSEFKRTLFALAAEASIQDTLFPDFTCKGDELVLEFDDALSSIEIDALPTAAQSALERLNKFLDQHAGENYAEHYCNNQWLYTSEVWVQIRVLANELIQSLGWTCSSPQTSKN